MDFLLSKNVYFLQIGGWAGTKGGSAKWRLDYLVPNSAALQASHVCIIRVLTIL